jgi:hypothetical protein
MREGQGCPAATADRDTVSPGRRRRARQRLAVTPSHLVERSVQRIKGRRHRLEIDNPAKTHIPKLNQGTDKTGAQKPLKISETSDLRIYSVSSSSPSRSVNRRFSE